MPGWCLIFYGFIFFILGTCLGSFANVCIYRLPRMKSIIVPRSNCPNCSARIAWYDNIPLLSFLLLRGKCRACGEKIAARYFIVELLTGALFVIIWTCHGFDIRTPVYWMVTTGLIIATFVDFDFMVIPDQITIGGIFLGIAASFFFPSLHTAALHYEGFKYSFIGFLAGALTLWLIGEIGRVAFKKEAMGMGDVKLIAALGSFLGWRAVFFTIMVASLFGAIAGMILIFSGNKKMGSKIPFGPYLAAAAVIWMIDGPQLWLAYLSFIHCNRP